MPAHPTHLEVDDHEEDGDGGQQLHDVGQALAVERVLLTKGMERAARERQVR